MAKVKVLVLSQTLVVKLFEALGYKTANTWDNARLMQKIRNLPDLVDGVKIKKPKVKVLLKKILKAKKVRIKMTGEEEAPKTTKKTAKKNKKKVESKSEQKKETEKKKKTKKVVSKRKGIDKFGSREGTIKARVNAVLTKKPKTERLLLKEAKIANPQGGHLRDLIRAGHIVKSEKGFALKR